MQLNKILEFLNFKTTAKLYSCCALVAVADFLFYGERIGWTAGLFGLLLLMASTIHNKKVLNHKLASTALLASFGLTLALVENPSQLTFWLCYLSVIFMLVSPKLAMVNDVRAVVGVIYSYLLTGWLRLYKDNIIIAHVRKRLQKIDGRKRSFIINWILPIGLSAVFIMLFAQANPIITGWINNISWNVVSQYFSVWRILFWLAAASTIWALIRPRLKNRAYRENKKYSRSKEFTLMALIFNERSVLTSLILFNALFFMQNTMDIAFLWSGAELPNGVNYAQYAHQGAYPLIATALLTALFILMAFKPQSVIEQSKIICALLYIWVGQNVFLVISSITRLMNYIAEYSLTYMRVSALIWMALVALGLILIITRIYLQKSNKWLVNINAIALYSILYICCFINFGGIIADYNVRHSQQITANGGYFDVNYLQREVGVDAIPALLWFEKNNPDNYNINAIKSIRETLQNDVKYGMENWREWTFRKYRLLQYVDKSPQQE